MSESQTDGNLYVFYLPACADITVPSPTEISAGTKVSQEMKTDDLDIQFTEQEIDNSNAESAFMATKPGRYGVGTISLTLDDDDGRVLFDTFTRGLEGFLLVARHGTPVADDIVEVYPVECHGSKPAPPVTNDKVKFMVNWAATSDPELSAVVTAA